MYQWILKDIICDEFERNVGKWQSKSEKPVCMLMSFALADEDRAKAQLLLYAPDNYVGVFHRRLASLKSTEWKVLAFHDSCWREDGLGGFFRDYGDRLICLHTMGFPWYQKVPVSEEFAAELKAARKARYG